MTEYIEKQHLLSFLDDCIAEEKGNHSEIIVKAIKMVVERMPSTDATKELTDRNVGKWIETKFSRFTYYKCSVCNANYRCENAEFDLNFCPNCGADNRGERDDRMEEEFRKRADLLMQDIKADDAKSEIPAAPRGLKEE